MKKGDRIIHKTLGSATVEGLHMPPMGFGSIIIELVNIFPDNINELTHSKMQLVHIDECYKSTI